MVCVLLQSNFVSLAEMKNEKMRMKLEEVVESAALSVVIVGVYYRA